MDILVSRTLYMSCQAGPGIEPGPSALKASALPIGSMGNIMEYSGLLEVIQLIYPGSTMAIHIMDGGYFDKAIRAHLIIDAAIYQHIMKLAFTEEERGDMNTFMEKVADGKMADKHSDPVVEVFEQRFEEIFKRLSKGGRTPSLWVE